MAIRNFNTRRVNTTQYVLADLYSWLESHSGFKHSILPHPTLPLRECQDSKEEEYVIGTYGDIFRQVYYSLEHVNGCVNIK